MLHGTSRASYFFATTFFLIIGFLRGTGTGSTSSPASSLTDSAAWETGSSSATAAATAGAATAATAGAA